MHRPGLEKSSEQGKGIPAAILDALFRLEARVNVPLYLVGGTVRDWLLGRTPGDIDITASCSAGDLARLLQRDLGGGARVDLSGPEDEVVRVVWRSQQIDFASFRGGVGTIEEDLRLRDFTINAMALPLAALAGDKPSLRLLDPTGGLADLHEKRIRHCPGAFPADPVRMLRGYRLAAALGFTLVEGTRRETGRHAPLIKKVAAERSSHELCLIFASTRTTPALQMMSEDGLLAVLLPELYAGAGVQQPEFHHLDVLGHSFLALAMMEGIIAEPSRYFPGHAEEITEYLQGENAVVCLKWAALLHDVGKPSTREKQPGDQGRVTFHGHDEAGVRIFQNFAERSRWSRADSERTARLIAMHMHPFHLCNTMRDGRQVSRRAVLKLCRRAEANLPGVFLLAMADSLASKGEKKPQRMEAELVELYTQVLRVYGDFIKPVLDGPRLLTGRDLIQEFALTPGPLFSTLLDELEGARVEGRVTDRETALAFIAACLRTLPPDGRMP